MMEELSLVRQKFRCTEASRSKAFMNHRDSCLVPYGKTLALCVVCGVTLPKPLQCMRQHYSGSRHIKNVESMSVNGISLVNGVVKCRPCNVTLKRRETVLYHIGSKRHDEWMTELARVMTDQYVDTNQYLACTSDWAFCSLCRMKLPCSPRILEEHCKNIRHRKIQLKWMKKFNGIVSLDKKCWCKLCNQTFDDGVESLNNHVLKEVGHKRRLSQVDNLIMGQGISIIQYLGNEWEMNAFCERCDVKFLCQLKMIECHIHSECHTLRVI